MTGTVFGPDGAIARQATVTDPAPLVRRARQLSPFPETRKDFKNVGRVKEGARYGSDIERRLRGEKPVNVPSKIEVEHEGRLVAADATIEGSVLVVRTEDGRSCYESVRAVPPELQLRNMLTRMLSADLSDPNYNPDMV